jgi:hypothetical protein
MTDRVSDEVLDHLIHTNEGILADAGKKGQVYGPIKNIKDTLDVLREAQERRADASGLKAAPDDPFDV